MVLKVHMNCMKQDEFSLSRKNFLDKIIDMCSELELGSDIL